MKGRALTARQVRFIEHYLVGLNASEAARASGYVGSRANVAGLATLKHPRVAAEIAERREAQAKAAQLTATGVLEGLAEIAYSKAAPAARVRALELLGKHLGLFADRSTVTVQGLDWRALLDLKSSEE